MFSKIRTIQTGIIRNKPFIQNMHIKAVNFGEKCINPPIRHREAMLSIEDDALHRRIGCARASSIKIPIERIEYVNSSSNNDKLEYPIKTEINNSSLCLVSLLNIRDAIFKDVVKRIDNQSLRKISTPMTNPHNNQQNQPFENSILGFIVIHVINTYM
jgi:hypothetical protein